MMRSPRLVRTGVDVHTTCCIMADFDTARTLAFACAEPLRRAAARLI
jgi:hypothetical protein